MSVLSNVFSTFKNHESYGFVLFLSKFILVYALMQVGYNEYVAFWNNSELIEPINNHITRLVVWVVNKFEVGNQTFYINYDYGSPMICANGNGYLIMSQSCAAIFNLLKFVAVMIAFPGKGWFKVVYTLVGLVFYHFSNSFRTLLLLIISYSGDGGEMFYVLKPIAALAIQLSWAILIGLWLFHFSKKH